MISRLGIFFCLDLPGKIPAGKRGCLSHPKTDQAPHPSLEPVLHSQCIGMPCKWDWRTIHHLSDIYRMKYFFKNKDAIVVPWRKKCSGWFSSHARSDVSTLDVAKCDIWRNWKREHSLFIRAALYQRQMWLLATSDVSEVHSGWSNRSLCINQAMPNVRQTFRLNLQLPRPTVHHPTI